MKFLAEQMILSTAICHFPRCDFLIIPGGVGFVAKRGERTSKVVLTEEGMTIDGDVHPDPTPIMDPFLQPFLALMNPQSTGQINHARGGYRYGMITVGMRISFVASGLVLLQCRVEQPIEKEVAKILNYGNPELVVLHGLKTGHLNGVLALVLGRQHERLQVDTGSKKVAIRPENCQPIQVWMDRCMTPQILQNPE